MISSRTGASRFLLAVLASASVVSLSACSSFQKADDGKQVERPAEDLYNEAAKALADKEYKKAEKLFAEVERQHPYSDLATQAQVKAAFSAYQDLRYDEAILALDRFIELHPGSPEVDYAYYLKAMCYYEQMSDVARDQDMTRETLEALNTLIQRYPDSKYVREAKLKRDLALDHLAGKEMEIGRYYMKNGEINAAINRFLAVVRDFQTTTHTPEALHRLVESYTILGLKDEATRIAAVLGYNYPGSRWYQDSFDLLDPGQRQKIQDKRSFLNRTISSILKPE